MSLKFFLVLSVLFTAALCAEREEGVLVLTDDNFDEEIKNNEFLLVEFYAPWCGHCKKLAPEFAKAAQRLGANTPAYNIAKLDATVHPKAAERFQVQGYPTLKFFRNGEATEYNGGRTADDIVSWILKKSGPQSKQIGSEKELEEFIKGSKVAVVYFGSQDDEQYKTHYIPTTSKFDKIMFAHSSTGHEAHGVSTTPALVLFKQFDEGKSVFSEEWSNEALESFIKANSNPSFFVFDDSTIEPIFGEKNPALFLFRDNNAEKTPELDKIFKELSSGDLKGKILFSLSDVKEGIQKRLADFVGVTDQDLPSVFIVNPQAELQKYKLEGDITAENIEKLFNNWKAGALKRHLKTEEIPAANDENVRTLVGKNFNEVVLDETKDVLVEFYAPWCGHCKSLAPIYEELATNLKGHSDIVIAKIDATANEVEGVSVTGFPTIKFWRRDQKSSPQDYNGDRTLEGFEKWLKENSKATWETEKTEL
jgi:protein disulfide-isomerase A1